ncbi:MAG: M6 family metalloprotease domain-containing protein [Gemmatimonadota bacterium]
MRTLRLLGIALLLAPVPGAAQDVEMLGRHYGTPVPDGYRALRDAQPDAFQYERGWGERGADIELMDGIALLRDGPQPLGPRSGPVTGAFEIPVLMGLFANSGTLPPDDSATIADAYFGPADGTITDYYELVSRGMVTLDGLVYDWVTAPGWDTLYTKGESGLTGGAGDFIKDLLDVQPPTDWGRFDNDGPDGVPNSGDDDGFVDVIAALHPTRGAECGGSGNDNRIWSHRWSLGSATGSGYITDTPAAGGGFIVINDYTIQPAVACSGGGLAPIGIFTHELGHAFGLPDLYDTNSSNGSHSGAGTWDLMGSGSWGCNNASAALPCHMGAWSKAVLGWVDITTLDPDTDHGTLTLNPVATSGDVYRIDATDGSGEYFLLENRQRLNYDGNLYSEGLLIWHIVPDILATEWRRNRVNGGDPMGVWLRQADGAGHLQEGLGRGDASDPFPGFSDNTSFHIASTPSSHSTLGGWSGLTIYDIAISGDDVTFGLTTRATEVSLTAQGSSTQYGLFSVDGVPVDPPETTFTSAPFLSRTVEVTGGEATAPGTRMPFVGWQDDPAAPRERTFDVPVTDLGLVAEFSGTEYELTVDLTGGVSGVEPGSFVSTPATGELWFQAGASVIVEAVPQTGFNFLQWSGDLAGQPNPATFTMTGPLAAGAEFELIYAVSDRVVDFPAATPLDIQLEVENGSDPVRWTILSGELPEGVTMSPQGRITGSALELGSFALTLEATDGLGLPGTGALTLDLTPPSIPIDQLTSTFLLSGPELTGAQINFLNLQGNGVAPYDIGDFRAWVLANPSLPLSAYFTAEPQLRTIVIPIRRDDEEGRR